MDAMCHHMASSLNNGVLVDTLEGGHAGKAEVAGTCDALCSEATEGNIHQVQYVEGHMDTAWAAT